MGLFEGVHFGARTCACTLCGPAVRRNSKKRHEQSGEGGQGQAEPAGPRQTRRGVAQVGVAACLGHGVNGCVGVALGEVHLFGLVALSHGKAALGLDVYEAGCGRATRTVTVCTLTLHFAKGIVLKTIANTGFQKCLLYGIVAGKKALS